MNIETIEAPKPSIIDELSPDYREDWVLQRGYLFLYKKELVISKAIFSTKVKESDDKLDWIVYVKIPADEFLNMVDSFKEKNGILLGELISPILFYKLNGNSKVEIEFDYKNKNIVYPKISKLYFSGHLADIFENGISLEEYSSIQEKLKDK